MGGRQVFYRPLQTDLKADFERGTVVRLEIHGEGRVEGRVARNPRETGCLELELQEARMIVGSGADRTVEWVNFYRADIGSIDKVVVLSTPKPRKVPVIEEKCHKTALIDAPKSFHHLMSILKDVTEVALNLYGVFVGRDGEVGWISLFLPDYTLVCIDVLAGVKQIKEFWNILEEKLFHNCNIRKVAYNARPIADYMYHKHGVTVQNMEDLQVLERCSALSQGETPMADMKYKSLSEMLEMYLKDIVPVKEIEYLKLFEQEDFSAKSPLMERPIQEKKYCKYVAIDMKYLLKLKTKLYDVLLQGVRSCVTTQIKGLVNANNGEMETQLKYPERIPQGVMAKLNPSEAKFFTRARVKQNGVVKGTNGIVKGANGINKNAFALADRLGLK